VLRLSASILLIILMIGHAVAGSKQAGRFDYYVLSLSWSPSWCALSGDAKGAAECASGKKTGFILHGLWPQYERGWPSFCATAFAPPDAETLSVAAKIMGSDRAARHQWDKHGRCSGLSPREYFATAQQAYDRVTRPALLRQVLRPVAIPARAVETAFVKANPSLNADMVSVTCRRGFFQEVRICLDKNLEPRTCGIDLLRDCDRKVTFPPVR